MKNQKSMGNKGFSLVELIVVIAIMAVLVGVLAPQFIKYVESSRQSTDIQNVQALKTAIETEAVDAGSAGTLTSSSLTITIDASAKTATVGNISLTTVTSPANLKSDGWNDGVFTYDATSGTWTAASNTNNNDPGKDLADVFN
jgi:type IV pilus assembly protein PilA